MFVDVKAHCATVFFAKDFEGVDKVQLWRDYDKTYHSARPANSVKVMDSYHFVTPTLSNENHAELDKINKLTSIPHLRAVNFIILDIPDKELTTEDVARFEWLMREYDGLFKKNSYNGSLVLSITTQNFSALLLEGHKVRGINRRAIGL